jgi:predicted membrane protein
LHAIAIICAQLLADGWRLWEFTLLSAGLASKFGYLKAITPLDLINAQQFGALALVEPIRDLFRLNIPPQREEHIGKHGGVGVVAPEVIGAQHEAHKEPLGLGIK